MLPVYINLRAKKPKQRFRVIAFADIAKLTQPGSAGRARSVCPVINAGGRLASVRIPEIKSTIRVY
jgi:hypothetical protein